MPKIIKKQEVLCFEGLSISDFLDKGFLKKIKDAGLDMEAINVVFMVRKDKEKKGLYPIIIGHESSKDLKKKIMHIHAPSSENSEKFIKLLEKME